MCSSGRLLPEFLGESDEDTFGASNVAEQVGVLVVDDFIDHRRAEPAESRESVIEVLDGEHDTQISQRVYGD